MALGLESFLHDMRFAARNLVRDRTFTCVATLTLALGIGATTGIYSVVNSTILRPLPFEEPARLMKVSLLLPTSAGLNADGTRREMIWSYPKYRLFRESQTVFESTATYLRRRHNLTGVDEPERLMGEVVGTSYFSVLGVVPDLGRGFLPDADVTPGANFEVVLSHGLWTRRFGADPQILGRTIYLNEAAHTVVGVLPQGFSGLWGMAELWVPTRTLGARLEAPMSHSYHVVARLNDEFTYDQARVAMHVIGGQVDEAFPDTESWSATARPLDQYRVSKNMRTRVLLLFGAAGLVLLTACVNVAGLVLSRSATRRREIATRLALGSGRLRLVRQLTTESLVLSSLAGLLGIAFAFVGVGYFNSLGAATRFQMSGLERTAFSSIHIDVGTMLFCVAAITTVPLLVGLLPAFRSTRGSLAEGLRAGATPGSIQGTEGRVALVLAQVALAFTLLVGSGLLIRTMGRLNQADVGFHPDGMMTVRITLPASRYDRPAQATLFAQLLERIRALPGVHSATFINCVPFADGCRNTSSIIARDGVQTESTRERVVGVNFVMPGYFEALGIAALNGRTFSTGDREDTRRVVVISRSTAELFWPGENPIGRSLSLRGFENAVVIGVVEDVRYDNIETLSQPDAYVSTSQSARREGFVVTRHSTEPDSHIAAMREAVRGLDRDLPLFDIRSMSGRVDDETWRTRFSTMLVSLFAVITLVLSAIGIYGLLSYAVERRTRDIGIMMALGAGQKTTLLNVVGRALFITAVGIALGILMALCLTRFMRAMLFETSSHDPLTYGIVAILFAAVSLLAGYFPARRACRVDPVEVLKAE
ncbi:MAG: ABC transporter permease [Gemmatimonadota bacterium]|nr:MAG: ABC transporter permease [Gemmatimonadota bacterium]